MSFEFEPSTKRRNIAALSQSIATAALAMGIFALDVLSPLQGAVAVLYTCVVFISIRAGSRNLTVSVALACAVLSITAYLISHEGEALGSALVRLGVSLVAIAITTLIAIFHQAAAERQRNADARYKALFYASAVSTWEGDWSMAYALLQDGHPADEELVDLAASNAVIGDANQAAANLFGLKSRQELVGTTLSQFHTPASKAALGRILQALLAGKCEVEEEARFVTAQGKPIDLVLRLAVPPQCREWRQVLVMAIDVTERNQAQVRLAQAQVQLTHVSRITTLGQLAASIAHEVNQPLSALITYAKSGKRWLAREAPSANEVAECLDRVVANGTRAADVIARIRALTRRADPVKEAIDLRPLVEETVELLRRDLNSHDVKMEVSVPAELPRLIGDRIQVQQVLMNLMLNAEQAMAQTPAAARVLQVSADRSVDGITVRVRDNGIGIGEEPEGLFNPFVTTKDDGMGMGLAICRSIVESHGGSLSAANHPEGGAVFSFFLPSADQVENAA
ncbi:PAS domain S-box-containing protein [Sphingomonas trueperi]|uniref:ATP-binding protein n=1 Tax=Sphingomonas trueperi TaxID=53317 RepID=UPI003391241F